MTGAGTLRGSLIAALLVAAAGCSLIKTGGGNPGPTPTPTPTPPPVPTIAVFTVQLTPNRGVVKIGSTEFATRPNGIVEEEFKNGQVLEVTARAVGFQPSAPVMVTMVGGRMPVLNITLEAVPVRGPPAITVAGKHFQADGKFWAPALISALDLLGRTPEQQAAYLDWVAKTGFDGVRIFAGELQPWSPLTPAMARQNLTALLDRVEQRGLVIEVTALTGTATGYDAKAHLVAIADLLVGRRGVFLELANEITNGSQDTRVTNAENLRAWGQEIATPRGLIWAIGSTDTDEPCPVFRVVTVGNPNEPIDVSRAEWEAAFERPPPNASQSDRIRQPREEVCLKYNEGEYPAGGGTYSTAHLDRGRPSWNNVRRVREIFAIADSSGRPSMNNEPMGADELDGRQTGKQRWNDPALFFTLGALDRAFNIGGIHHSEAGRYSQIPGPVQQACAEAYLAGHRAVDTAMQGLPGSYRNVNHGGSPIVNANFGDDGVVRAYSFITGNIGVTVVVGAGANPRIEWGNGWPAGAEVASMAGQDGRRAVVLALKK